MGLRTSYRQARAGIRIPYPPARDGTRSNHGFVDLRGRPLEAAAIAEAAGSSALRALLVRLAQPDAPLFTLGCDLGVHAEPSAPAPARHVAGGYLHAVAAAHERTAEAHYHAFATALEGELRRIVGNRSWDLAFVLQQVELALTPDPPIAAASLSICFYAAAARPALALRSREALVKAIDAAIGLPAVVEAFHRSAAASAGTIGGRRSLLR